MYMYICIFLCERRVKLIFEVNTSHMYMCICTCMYVNNLFTCMYVNNLFTCMYVNNLFTCMYVNHLFTCMYVNNLWCTMSVGLTLEELRTRTMYMCICIYTSICYFWCTMSLRHGVHLRWARAMYLHVYVHVWMYVIYYVKWL